MSELLTVSQIQSKFDREWVLLEDPQIDDKLQILGGKVVFHSKDRDEVDRKALELRPRHSAFLYTGSMLDDTAIVL
jgi:hypothetical protein